MYILRSGYNEDRHPEWDAGLSISINRERLAEEAKKHTGCYCRADYACNVRSHGVHEKEVSGIFLRAYGL